MSVTGIIIALVPEATCLARPVPPAGEITALDGNLLLVSGIGASAAASAAEQLVSAGVDGLLSLGTSGALAAGMYPGDLVLGREVTGDGDELVTSAPWRRRVLDALDDGRRNIHQGRIAAAAAVVENRAAKLELGRSTTAIAVDMESLAILKVAARHNLPGLVLRTILDTVDMDIPGAIGASMDRYGRVRPGRMLHAVARDPATVYGIIRLARAYRYAAATLRYIGTRLGDLGPVS